MEAFELSKLINSINSILLQDVSTIKTISSTEMWPPIYVCNMDKFVPILFHFCSKIGETLTLPRSVGKLRQCARRKLEVSLRVNNTIMTKMNKNDHFLKVVGYDYKRFRMVRKHLRRTFANFHGWFGAENRLAYTCKIVKSSNVGK